MPLAHKPDPFCVMMRAQPIALPSSGHVTWTLNTTGSPLQMEHCDWLVCLSVIPLHHQMVLERLCVLCDLLVLDLIVARLQCGKHDSMLSVLNTWIHQVLDQTDL